jgi:hypothetical protein
MSFLSSSRARQLAVAVSATALVTGGLAALPNTALALTGSTFESTDGNLVVDTAGNHDWVNAPGFREAIDLPSGTTDNSFGQGSKDDLTNVTVVSGSIPPNKSDLTRFYLGQEAVGGSQFLYLAWERSNVLGTANFSFELNQAKQPSLINAPGVSTQTYALDRRAGDVLITYDLAKGGNVPTIGLAQWVTTGNAKTVCQANSTVPCWSKIKNITASGFADGAFNSASVNDPIDPNNPPTIPPTTSRKLDALEFGEAAINLTAAHVLNPCKGFSSAYVKGRSSSAFDSELKDFIAPFEVNILQSPDVSGAQADSQDPSYENADGSYDGALAVRITDSGSSPVDLPAHHTSSRQAGAVGQAVDGASAGPVDDPITGGHIVHAQLLTESSTSTIDAKALANQTTYAEVAGLNVLDGTLTADAVDAVALASASPDLANTNSTPTTFVGAQVDPDGSLGPVGPKSVSVTPGLSIPLSSTFFGSGSYIAFLQEDATGSAPPLGTAVGTTGTYDASLRVTAVHVHVTDRDPVTIGNQTTDVVVSKAFAHARYTGAICTSPQRVSGNAAILTASSPLIGPDPVTLGNVRIPATGGHDHAGVASATYPATGLAVASVGVATTDTMGSFNTNGASSTSYADVANVCIQQTGTDGNGDPVCTVMARVVHAQANSSADSGSATANSNGTAIVGLTIAGTPIDTSVAPPPNTVVLLPRGAGEVVLNEEFCDSGLLSSSNTCSAGHSAGITVRTLHVLIFGVLDVIIGEAHADATFVPA